MPYPTVSSARAKEVLLGRTASTDVLEKPQGPPYSWEEKLASAARQLEPLLGDVESQLVALAPVKRKMSEAWRSFEVSAARTIHDAMPRTHEALSDREFWTWAACFPLRDVIRRRYAGKPKHAPALENFGIGSFSENFVYRSWLRAEICTVDPEDGPCDLIERGSIDFWRSHIFRQRYGASPALARAFVRAVYPHAEEPTKATLSGPDIRQLAKNIRKVASNLLVATLDEHAAEELLRREMTRLRGNDGPRLAREGTRKESPPRSALR
ncbi:MAG: DUF6339 family protein [Bryobacteraceae bacterium]|nr:DUF6339 family protein [Bryobacteraceae bacterium]